MFTLVASFVYVKVDTPLLSQFYTSGPMQPRITPDGFIFQVGIVLSSKLPRLLRLSDFSMLLEPQEKLASLSCQTQEGWLASKNLLLLSCDRQAPECLCSAHQPLAWGGEQTGCPLARTRLSPTPSPTHSIAFDGVSLSTGQMRMGDGKCLRLILLGQELNHLK